jgi:hypothetical protein
MKFHHIVSVAAILLSTSTASLAAPAGLLNKSIHISYATFIPARTADGRINRGTRKVSMTIYVSSAGRIFLKKANRTGGLGRDFEAAPERTAHGFHLRAQPWSAFWEPDPGIWLRSGKSASTAAFRLAAQKLLWEARAEPRSVGLV